MDSVRRRTHGFHAEGTLHASAGRRRAQAKAGGLHVFLLTSFMQVAAMETPESVDTDFL